jgi:hypothetical protein
MTVLTHTNDSTGIKDTNKIDTSKLSHQIGIFRTDYHLLRGYIH